MAVSSIRKEINTLGVLLAATEESEGNTRDTLRSQSVAQAIKVNEMLCEGAATRKVRETLAKLRGEK